MPGRCRALLYMPHQFTDKPLSWWMLEPEGVALFYVRPEQRDQLQLKQLGKHMIENHLNSCSVPEAVHYPGVTGGKAGIQRYR